MGIRATLAVNEACRLSKGYIARRGAWSRKKWSKAELELAPPSCPGDSWAATTHLCFPRSLFTSLPIQMFSSPGIGALQVDISGYEKLLLEVGMEPMLNKVLGEKCAPIGYAGRKMRRWRISEKSLR